MRKKASSPRVSASAAAFRAVERAIDDLRRGWPVVIAAAPDSREGMVAAAAETAQADQVNRLRSLCDPLTLMVTAQRAAVLHLHGGDKGAAAIWIDPDDPLEEIVSLADATQDLQRPLRGPYRSVAPPPAADAALALAKHADLLPSVIGGPVSVAEGASVAAMARREDLLTVTPEAVGGYDPAQALNLTIAAEARLPTALAENARIFAFRPRDGRLEHLALLIGDPRPHNPVLVRLHSECLTGDILGSLRCDCGDQLKGAIKRLGTEGGILLYLRQEGRGIGLLNKLRAYELQDEGYDTYEANQRLGFKADERLFLPASQMLKALGFTKIRLLTNNPEKVEKLRALGIDVVERVAHAFPSQAHNQAYLRAKAKLSGHYLEVADTPPEEEGR